MERLKQLMFILIWAVLSGCTGMQPDTIPSVTESTSMVTTPENSNMLLDEQCTLFQWQEFIPRKTTAQEALDWLNQNPSIVEIKVYDDEINGQTLIQEITGHYQNAASSPPETGFRITFTKQPSNNVIDAIITGLDNDMKLEDIVERCGEPSYIFAFHDYGIETPNVYWAVRLFWVEKGLVIRTSGEENPSPRIDENLPLHVDYSFLEIMSPSEEIIKQRWPDFSPWQGYQDFEYYRVEVE